MNQKKFEADLWIVVKPAPDVAGEWISHCLSLDVVSQGTSFEHALEMIQDAVSEVVVQDLLEGRDPNARKEKTPQEDWDLWSGIMKNGERTQIGAVSSLLKNVSKKTAVALTYRYSIRLLQIPMPKPASQATRRALRSHPPTELRIDDVPQAWMIDGAHAAGRGAHS